MNRNFYTFAIFFTGLYVAIAFFQSTIYFQLGTQIFSLESFPTWYACMHMIALITSLVMLKYYYYKGYRFTFWAATVSTIATIFEFIVVYSLLTGKSEMRSLYIPMAILVLGTGVIYSTSLIFSDAGERRWLKAAGVVLLVIVAVLMSSVILSANSGDMQKNALALTIHQWTSLIVSLLPVLFIMNFLDEQKTLRKNSVDAPLPGQRTLENVMAVTGVIAMIASLSFGASVASQSMDKLSWERKLSALAKEWAEIFESRTFVGSNGESLQYQLLKPLDFDPQKRYPLVVCLPYSGGVEGCPPAQVLLSDFNRKKYPAFLFVPTCPEGAGWGGVPNYPTIDVLVFEAIDSLQEEFNEIDENRCYVTGVSRGGYGSWHFISRRPDMFAAAVPVCGEGDPALASDVIDVAVWAFHGEEDRNVPVSGSRNMIAAIKDAGGDPRYTEFRGAGHNIWEQVKNTPGLLDWLFDQERD